MHAYDCHSFVHSRTAASALVSMGRAPVPAGPSQVEAANPSSQLSAEPALNLQDARQEGKDDALPRASQSEVGSQASHVESDAVLSEAEEVVADWFRSTYQGLSFPPGVQSAPTFVCMGEEGVCTSLARSVHANLR